VLRFGGGRRLVSPGRGGCDVFSDPLGKKVLFLTAPACRNSAALSSLSDEHSRPTAAVRGVLAALAESRQTGTVRNTPFLRPVPKKHHSRPAQGKPAAGRHQSEARPRYLFPSSFKILDYSHALLYNKMNYGNVFSGGILMIKSMTGFGRCEISEAERKITVEMKSVNHRYLDVSIKMPKKLNFFEASIRSVLKEYIQRGKVDLFITYEDFTENNVTIKYNRDIAGEYMQYLKQMAEDFSLDNDIRVSSLSRFPEVFSMEEQAIDEEGIWKTLEKALRGAAEGLSQTRITEGENLKEDLISKLDGMLESVAFIEERSPQIIAEYRQTLKDKVKELLEDAQVDENRLLMEVTIFADKVCVDEELVRLRSHIETTKKTLGEGGSIGRKLDFIAQEMNREANTILSKANDLETSDRAIELKTEIEKVREQIQNIE